MELALTFAVKESAESESELWPVVLSWPVVTVFSDKEVIR